MKILVAYTTNAGTTVDVAQAIADELGKDGAQAEVRRLEEIASLEGYSGVVVGAPMIMGWHPAAVRFIKKFKGPLSRMPVAYFFTAMRLTGPGETSFAGIPLSIDPAVIVQPANPHRLGIKERYASLRNYLQPVLSAAPAVRPVSLGFFGGRLEMFRLKWWQALFVMVVIQAPPGGVHDLPLIRTWAAGLRPLLGDPSINL